MAPGLRDWLWLWRLGRRPGRRGGSPRGHPARPPSGPPSGLALVKRPFPGPEAGFGPRGVRPPSPNVVVSLRRRPRPPRAWWCGAPRPWPQPPAAPFRGSAPSVLPAAPAQRGLEAWDRDLRGTAVPPSWAGRSARVSLAAAADSEAPSSRVLK